MVYVRTNQVVDFRHWDGTDTEDLAVKRDTMFFVEYRQKKAAVLSGFLRIKIQTYPSVDHLFSFYVQVLVVCV